MKTLTMIGLTAGMLCVSGGAMAATAAMIDPQRIIESCQGITETETITIRKAINCTNDYGQLRSRQLGRNVTYEYLTAPQVTWTYFEGKPVYRKFECVRDLTSRKEIKSQPFFGPCLGEPLLPDNLFENAEPLN